jgi:aryl-alcohol dehydrogenase-like predicted oxidoreductase
MRYNLLGRSGLRVSCLGLGTATFGVAPLAGEAGELVARALDLGINLFDTANSYGNQSRFDRVGAPPAAARRSAEEILGEALAPRRNRVVLCSKVMEPVGVGPNDSGLSRLHILRQIDESLRRLRTDYVDVYYAHHPDPQTPIEETVLAFSDLVVQGKIRYYALSTFNAWKMTEVLWACERLNARAPICNQISYSLANRDAELNVIPACLRFGLGTTVFGPLSGGLLAGTDALRRPVSGDQRWGFAGFTPAQLDLAKSFNAIASECNVAPATLALAWVTSRPGVSAALIGPESVQELEVDAAPVEFELSKELLDRIDLLGHPEPRSWY